MEKSIKLCEAVNNGGIIYSMLQQASEERFYFSIRFETKIFGQEESVIVEDITSDEDFCRKIMYALADGFVTPSAAHEVVENYIVEFV